MPEGEGYGKKKPKVIVGRKNIAIHNYQKHLGGPKKKKEKDTSGGHKGAPYKSLRMERKVGGLKRFLPKEQIKPMEKANGKRKRKEKKEKEERGAV